VSFAVAAPALRKADRCRFCESRCNANAALVFEFCYRLINIGRSYFARFDEEAVKNNFVLLYELLDGEAPLPCP
jgi:hypothetical protein